MEKIQQTTLLMEHIKKSHMQDVFSFDEVRNFIEKCFEQPEIITKAKAEFDERLGGQTYECLIPSDVKPHIIQ
mgnify:CR=1 FL=1